MLYNISGILSILLGLLAGLAMLYNTTILSCLVVAYVSIYDLAVYPSYTMKLNVLKTSNNQSPDFLFRIINDAYIRITEPCCVRHDLDIAIALTCPDYPYIQNANCVIDVNIPKSTSIISTENALKNINGLFQNHNLKCHKWINQYPDFPTNLADKLIFNNYKPQRNTLLQLQNYQLQTTSTSIPNLQVIPARSAISLYRQFLLKITSWQKPDNDIIIQQWADWNINILDNYKLDVLVTRQKKQITSAAGILTSGENGVIINHVILNPETYDAYDQTQPVLFEHVFNLCARAQLKNIIIECPASDTDAISFYTSLGFKQIADRIIFLSRDTPMLK